MDKGVFQNIPQLYYLYLNNNQIVELKEGKIDNQTKQSF